MTRLTIGIDASRAFAGRPTGTENYSARVIESLVQQGDHNYRLYVREETSSTATSDVRGRAASGIFDGAEVCVLRAPRIWTHTSLALEVAVRPPDVLFVPSHVLPLTCRPPAVVTVHDLGHRAWPGAHTRLQRWYLELNARRHVRSADHVIADSSATRQDLIGLYSAAPERITVALLGVDSGMQPVPHTVVTELRERLGLPAGSQYFLHVGTVQPRKNLTRLVEAFSLLAADRDNLVLVLAGGTGWGDDDPLEYAGQIGIGDRVVHVGYVDQPDLPALYSGSLATVVPSLYEGFGLPVLEAMACGAPVAASTSSSLPEVVGGAGLLFDPLDVQQCAAVLRRLADDEALRAGLSKAGVERAGAFTWRKCAGTVQRVLETVVADKKMVAS